MMKSIRQYLTQITGIKEILIYRPSSLHCSGLYYATIFRSLALICLFAINPANAGDTPIDDAIGISDASLQPLPLDVTGELEKQIEEYLSSDEMAGFAKRQREGDIYIGYATEEVAVGPENRAWGKHRVMAFERALIKAENQYVTSAALQISATKVRDLFQDGSGEMPVFKDDDLTDSSSVSRILEKLQGIIEGRLDKTLEELGINPADYTKASKKQRSTLLRDGIVKESTKKAVGSLAGLAVLETFEGASRKRHAIGVVVMVSPALRQLAQEVLTARGNIEPRKTAGRDPIRVQVENLKEDLLTNFGVRAVIDENGYPAIISFGQWANAVSKKDERLASRFRSIAQDQARALADQNIALFLNGASMYESETTIGNAVENYLDVDSTGFLEESNIATITDIIKEKARSRGKANITGLQDIYKWTMRHPVYGHEIVGVVRVWSPVTERAARRIKGSPITSSQKDPSNPNAATTSSDSAPDGVVIKSSGKFMNHSDF